MDLIHYLNTDYFVKEIEFDFGCRLISTQSLNDVLLTSEGEYTSDSARNIDENIFYFFEDKDLKMENKALARKVLSEL